MEYRKLLQKREEYQKRKAEIPELTILSFDKAFEIEYTHNSTAIEGNSLTLMETKLVLEDKISVGGKELREIYEQVNHQRAFRYVKECIVQGLPLEEKIVLNIHRMLMEGILPGGIYRDTDIYISGAQHTPPSASEMNRQLEAFYADLSVKKRQLNLIELAAWTHAEFVRIHPFPDGNGRTARLLLNYQLMANGFVPISIAKENRLEYYNALEAYAVDGFLAPFAEMIAGLEGAWLDRYIGMVPAGNERGGHACEPMR